MIPNSACELLLFYLLSSLKTPSFLAQNLSFCQIDVWDSVLLLNCPGQEVFEVVVKRSKALATAICNRLDIKIIHVQWQKEVADFFIDDLLNGQNDRPLEEISDLAKQNVKPLIVAKLNGQISFVYLPQNNENLPTKNIYISGREINRLAEAVESHGWVNGYRLRLNTYESRGIFVTVRARYAKNSLLNELVLLIQVLNVESSEVVPSRDIA